MDLDNKPQDEYRREHITYIPPDITELSVNDYTIQSGIHFKDFDHMKVHCSGNHIPPPLSSFKDADLSTELLSGLKYMNYEKPTPVQKCAIPCINSGRDIIACSQTGSGKTAAYLLPIINILLKSKKSCTGEKYSFPRALILAPTRELALQISAIAYFLSKNTCINIGSVYGGINVAHQVNKIKNSDIIVATPGRLLHLLSENQIKLSLIKFIVFDEADHILDLDLWSEVEEIMDRYNNTKCEETGQMLMFSATFPEELQQLACNFLKNYIFLSVGIVGIACKDVDQMFYQIKDSGKNEKLVKLMELLDNQDPKGTLVFVKERKFADFLTLYLAVKQKSVKCIHSDYYQKEREEALGMFRSGQVDILVTTSLTSRGLDIKNIRHVINFDMPDEIEEYIHRIGRTGRVGNCGKASSLIHIKNDSHIISDLVKMLRQVEQSVPLWMESQNPNVNVAADSRSDLFNSSDDIRNPLVISKLPTRMQYEETW